MKKVYGLLLLVVVLVVTGELFAADPRGKVLDPGSVWGGNGIELHVDLGESFVLFNCAVGRITGEFVTAKDGTFDLPGTYQFIPGVPPPREDEDNVWPTYTPARFVGRVQGTKITLTAIHAVEGYGFTPTLFGKKGEPGTIYHCY